jgi:hypothetical protein
MLSGKQRMKGSVMKMARRFFVSVILLLVLLIRPSAAAEIKKVYGRVVDETGKPLSNVKWQISGIEEFRDGHWTLVFRLGEPEENVTDANGCFVVEFREKLRYDLQFDKLGLGQFFLYQVSAESPELMVVIKKGVEVCGSVSRLVVGIREPVCGEGIITFRLSNPRGLWYQQRVFTDEQGRVFFFSSVTPTLPTEFVKSVDGRWITKKQPPKPKWQVVLGGEVVQIDVEQDKPVDDINFEIQISVIRGPV